MKNPRLPGKIIFSTLLLLILIGMLSSIVYSSFQGFVSASHGQIAATPPEMFEGNKHVDDLSRTSSSWRRQLSQHIFTNIDHELQSLEKQFILHDSALGKRLIQRIKISLQKMIFGKQKFVRTGQEPALASFYAGRTVLEYNLWKMKGLTQNLGMDDTQSGGLYRVYALTNKWLVYVAHREISARRKGTLDTSLQAETEQTGEQGSEGASSTFAQISEAAKITQQDMEKAGRALSQPPVRTRGATSGIKSQTLKNKGTAFSRTSQAKPATESDMELETLESEIRQEIEQGSVFGEDTLSQEKLEENANPTEASSFLNWMFILGTIVTGIALAAFMVIRRKRKLAHLSEFHEDDTDLVEIDTLIASDPTEDNWIGDEEDLKLYKASLETSEQPTLQEGPPESEISENRGSPIEEWVSYNELEEPTTDGETPEDTTSQVMNDEPGEDAQDDMVLKLEELTQGLENKFTENDALTKDLETSHKETGDLEKQLETLHAENEELSQGMENIIADRNSLTEKMGNLNKEKEELSNELKRVHTEYNSLKEKSETIHDEENNLDKQLEILRADKEQLTQKLEKINEKNNSLTEKLETAREEKEEQDKQLKTLSAEGEELTQGMESILAENNSLTEKIEDLTKEEEGLEKELENTLAKNNSLTEKLSASLEEREELSRELKNTLAEYSSLKEKSESLREEEDSQEKQLETLHTGKERLTQQLDTTLADNCSLEEKIENLNKEREGLEQTLENALTENNSLTEKLGVSLEEKGKLSHELKSVLAEHSALKEKSEDLHKEEDNQEKQLETLSTEKEELAQGLENVLAENNSLTEKLENLEREKEVLVQEQNNMDARFEAAQEKIEAFTQQNEFLMNQWEAIQTENHRTTEAEHSLTLELEALSCETKALKEKLESINSENEALVEQLKSANTIDLSFDSDTPEPIDSQAEKPTADDYTPENTSFQMLNFAQDLEKEALAETDANENQNNLSAPLTNHPEASHPDVLLLQTVLKAAKGFVDINKRLHKIAEIRFTPSITDSRKDLKGNDSQET